MPATVIITGASRGIGLAVARFLRADGARVVTVQRTITPELQDLSAKHPRALINIQGDCAAEDVIKTAIGAALQTFGSVDAVVFNAAAGAYSVAHVDAIPLEDWQRTFDVNVFGVVRFLREVLPHLSKSPGSRIVFTSSAAAEHSLYGVAPYSASKAALNSINRTVAAEHPDKVCVAVHPGSVRTEMAREFSSQAAGIVPETFLTKLFENVLEPEVPARVIANLALRAPAAVSGEYLHWDDPSLEGI